MGDDNDAEDDGKCEVTAVRGSVGEGRLSEAAGVEGTELVLDLQVTASVRVDCHFDGEFGRAVTMYSDVASKRYASWCSRKIPSVGDQEEQGGGGVLQYKAAAQVRKSERGFVECEDQRKW